MPKRRGKLTAPGWKIEPKYRDKVLIGNWFEERQQFFKGGTMGISTNHLDYVKPRPSPIPDMSTRRKLALKNWEGVGRNSLINGNGYKTNLITNHIVDYQAPLLTAPIPNRRWSSIKCSWLPEKLDRPVEGIQLPRLLKRKQYETGNIPNAHSSKKRDGNQCPPINIPHAYKHEPPVIKYRHRNTDVTPFFPVILRTTPRTSLVVKWNM